MALMKDSGAHWWGCYGAGCVHGTGEIAAQSALSHATATNARTMATVIRIAASGLS